MMGSMRRRTTAHLRIVSSIYLIYLSITGNRTSLFIRGTIFIDTFIAQEPACPKGLMQFQHGTFKKAANGSLLLTPFAVDGRQLLSDPCRYSTSIYTRYNQPERFQVSDSIFSPYPPGGKKSTSVSLSHVINIHAILTSNVFF